MGFSSGADYAGSDPEPGLTNVAGGGLRLDHSPVVSGRRRRGMFWLFIHAPCNRCIKAEGAARSEVTVLQLALGDAMDHHCDAQENLAKAS
jgi:hypothetical protein